MNHTKKLAINTSSIIHIQNFIQDNTYYARMARTPCNFRNAQSFEGKLFLSSCGYFFIKDAWLTCWVMMEDTGNGEGEHSATLRKYEKTYVSSSTTRKWWNPRGSRSLFAIQLVITTTAIQRFNSGLSTPHYRAPRRVPLARLISSVL